MIFHLSLTLTLAFVLCILIFMNIKINLGKSKSLDLIKGLFEDTTDCNFENVCITISMFLFVLYVNYKYIFYNELFATDPYLAIVISSFVLSVFSIIVICIASNLIYGEYTCSLPFRIYMYLMCFIYLIFTVSISVYLVLLLEYILLIMIFKLCTEIMSCVINLIQKNSKHSE